MDEPDELVSIISLDRDAIEAYLFSKFERSVLPPTGHAAV
jgi:hypothetical protein